MLFGSHSEGQIRGSQTAEIVERKVKCDWNWPDPIVAKRGITEVAKVQLSDLWFVFRIIDKSNNFASNI